MAVKDIVAGAEMFLRTAGVADENIRRQLLQRVQQQALEKSQMDLQRQQSFQTAIPGIIQSSTTPAQEGAYGYGPYQEGQFDINKAIPQMMPYLSPEQGASALINMGTKDTPEQRTNRIILGHLLGQKEPTTAISAYLAKNPNATPEQIAAYQRSLSPTMGGEGKPVNMPQWYDDLGVSVLGAKYHTPDGQRKFADFIATPAGQTLKEQAQKKYTELNAPPIYTFPQTNQGIVPGNVRTGEMGPSNGYGKPMGENTVVAEQQISTLYDILNNVKKSYKPEYVGPIYGSAGMIASEWINIPKDQASFYAYNAQINNTLVYLLSGKQINEQEYKRLKKQMPSPDLPENTYEARMENFRTTLDSIIEERHKNMGAYNPPGTIEGISKEPRVPNMTIRYDSKGNRVP